MSHRSITILAVGAAFAALAPASVALAQSASAPASGSGVPAGRIELTIRSVHVTGSNAVPRYERTRQYLTADESHTITTTVPQHKLRFEGFTSPQRELRYDAATKRVTSLQGLGHAAVPDRRPGGGRLRPADRPGLLDPAGNLVFEGRGSTRYNLVPATSGPCRGDAQVGQAIVDRKTGAVLSARSARPTGHSRRSTSCRSSRRWR